DPWVQPVHPHCHRAVPEVLTAAVAAVAHSAAVGQRDRLRPGPAAAVVVVESVAETAQSGNLPGSAPRKKLPLDRARTKYLAAAAAAAAVVGWGANFATAVCWAGGLG
ncbi:hypothetical protein Vafri_19278, partial [Volvox africanus]